MAKSKKRAIAVAVAFICTAAAATAQDVSYQGLTLGEGLPEDISWVSNGLHSERLNADKLPAGTLDLCEHSLPMSVANRLLATTRTCDGPIVKISAVRNLSVFFDPDTPDIPVTTMIDGLTFHETTLAEAVARFCSNGLIAPRWFGQLEPDNINAFALAYGIEGTDTIAAFWFQMPTTSWILAPSQIEKYSRGDSVLVVIEVMDAAQFEAIIDAAPVPSAGYIPIPNIFDQETAPQDAPASDCAFS